jgi:hypothetical protein
LQAPDLHGTLKILVACPCSFPFSLLAPQPPFTSYQASIVLEGLNAGLVHHWNDKKDAILSVKLGMDNLAQDDLSDCSRFQP